MATSIVSALTGIPIDKNIAMTGEITLRGNVLPIGGLKEKCLAAHRGGIRRIMLPKENENDIEDIPVAVRNDLELIPVAHVDEVLYEALRTEDSKTFEKILDRKVARDQLLFDDEPQKHEGSGQAIDKDKSGVTVVTH
jgi:ATP-dependent Lon protease